MADQSGLVQVDKYAPETEVHKYLHSRLAPFDTASLYELHYQMITLGKVSAATLLCGPLPALACPHPLGTLTPASLHHHLSARVVSCGAHFLGQSEANAFAGVLTLDM